MQPKLHLICCSNLAQEFELLLASEDRSDIELLVYPVQCDQKPIGNENLEAWLEPRRKSPGEFVFVGSSCLSEPNPDGSEPACRLYRLNQCLHLFLNESLIAHYIQQGAYLLTPGWLAHWRSHFRQWDFDRPTAREFFGESIRSLLLLETSPDKGNAARLAELADYIGLPYATLPVGLDLMRLHLHKIIADWRMKHLRQVSWDSLAQATRQSADSEMVIDMIGSLALAGTEDQAVERLFDLFMMMFAAERLAFLPFVTGQAQVLVLRQAAEVKAEEIRERLRHLSAPWEYTESGHGFRFRIEHRSEFLGCIEVEGIRFPGYKEQYLESALKMAPVAGLALANARALQRLTSAVSELEKALANIKTLSGLLPICASCKRIRDDTGYWQQLESYISQYSSAEFSHGICPECLRKLYPDLADEILS
jgi:hypothetical protein